MSHSHLPIFTSSDCCFLTLIVELSNCRIVAVPYASWKLRIVRWTLSLISKGVGLSSGAVNVPDSGLILSKTIR